MKNYMIKKSNLYFSFECFLLCLFLILFPIDSSLRMLIGIVSPNNYIALLFIVWTLLFRFHRINKAKIVDLFFIFYFFYQLILILTGPDLFNDRNLVFLLSYIFGLVVGAANWEPGELLIIRKSFIIGLLPVIIITLSSINLFHGRMSFVVSEEMDQNYLSANLIFGISILLSLINLSKKTIKKILYIFLLICSILSIVLLGSRGGVLGVTAIVLSYYAFIEKRRKLLILLIIFALVLLLFPYYSHYLPEWIRNRFAVRSMLDMQNNNRIQIWIDCISHFKSSSLLQQFFGEGRGAGRYISWNVTHNIYIKMLIDGGILGITLMFVFYYSLFRIAQKNKNRVAIIALIGYLVCGFFLDLDNYRIFGVLFAFTRLPIVGDTYNEKY